MPYRGAVNPKPITRPFGYDVRPVKIGTWNEDLHTRVSRVVGYRFYCDCGSNGPRTDTYAQSRSLGLAHTIAAHR